MNNLGPLGRIILVDSDPNITELLRFNLGSEGFYVEDYKRAADLDIGAAAEARLVIVDSMNEEYTGLDLATAIKGNPQTQDTPIIICTDSEGEDIIVDALDAGADDFIAKPFSLRELIARVKAVLRRHPRKQPAPAVSGHRASPTVAGISVPALGLFIDTSNQRVVENGNVVPLTKTEYQILAFLVKNQNTFYSRNEICDEVWKEEAGNNARIVDTNISRLRKKLGETGKYIINRYGMGYAFVDKLM